MRSFHDCHVYGIQWQPSRFTFSLDLDYVLEWIEPAKPEQGYRFLVSQALLTFRDVDDVRLSIAWSGGALRAEIAKLEVLESRSTPNGQTQRLFSIEFSDPDGTLSLWSTGYQVDVLSEPTTATTPDMGRG